jgi:hypothetical protein
MKLLIKRDQAKALLGGVKFELYCRVELTPEEQELIKKYKAHKEPLAYTQVKGTEIPSLYMQDLIDGVSYKAKDIETLLNIEEVIKEACRSFKKYLQAMASFGGEEVIEF